MEALNLEPPLLDAQGGGDRSRLLLLSQEAPVGDLGAFTWARSWHEPKGSLAPHHHPSLVRFPKSPLYILGT